MCRLQSVGRSTVRPHHASATGAAAGFRFDVGWISRWPPWSTCRCPAWLQRSSLSAADCQLVSDEGHCQLRSATSRTCVVMNTIVVDFSCLVVNTPLSMKSQRKPRRPVAACLLQQDTRPQQMTMLEVTQGQISNRKICI